MFNHRSTEYPPYFNNIMMPIKINHYLCRYVEFVLQNHTTDRAHLTSIGFILARRH